MSSEKINELKSKLIFSPNTSQDYKALFQDTIRVKENDNLETYLRLPTTHKISTRSQVQFVVGKARAKLSSWKAKFLSKVGCLCLISSTISTIPAYYMQASMFLISIMKNLDSTCNNFLWGDSNESKKLHLVEREQTFIPKDRGGLGIRS